MRLAPLHGPATLVLGCSAGGDSMALLELCAIEAPGRGWRLHVAHLDHAQRGESAGEAEFVAGRCRALGVEFHSMRLEGIAPGAGEDAMRRARHDFFKRVMAETGAGALLLAHQADDRAETFLIRLLAGSGPTGLASIRETEEIDGMLVVRPLLGFRREELRAWLAEQGLGWRDDPSNEDERYQRVWVRRNLLPKMSERMGVDVTQRIARASELAESESAALSQACGLMLGEITRPAAPPLLGSLALEHPLWIGAGAELRRQLMREWLWRLRTGPHPPGFAAVEEAVAFAERGAQGVRLRTVEGIKLEKKSGRLEAEGNT